MMAKREGKEAAGKSIRDDAVSAGDTVGTVEGKEAAGKETGHSEEAVKEAVSKEVPKTDRGSNESVYTADEFVAGAKRIFGTGSDIVRAALRNAGKSACTVSEAREHVERFMKKEVR